MRCYDVTNVRSSSTFAGWDLRYATQDHRLEPWRGERLELPVHGIWARPETRDPWFCEFLLQEADGQQWVYRRDQRVRRPLEEIAVTTSSGLSMLAPEIVLLYKANDTGEKEEGDFAVALPLLSPEARGWLAGALAIAHPGHGWIARL